MKREFLSFRHSVAAFGALLIGFFLATAVAAAAQQTRSLNEQIQSVRLIVDGDPLLPPVTRLGKHVDISFDALTHAYTRYVYKVSLCDADWTENTEVIESDWLQGFNSQPIEDYETSFNTSVLYTHYRFSIPNDDVRLLLPGTYRVQVFSDDADDEPVMEACFSLFTPEMSLAATVSTNTDVDFNRSHQQVTWSLSYGARRVVDPQRELHTVVMQNRRRDTAVTDLTPNIQRSSGLEWTHRRELVFDAGAEYHKFELLDVRRVGMGIDRMVWEEPIYHALLFQNEPQRNYNYAPDANGAWVVRRSGADDDADTQAEYVFVHFTLRTPPLPGGDVYVNGQWDNGFPDPRCRMTYDERNRAYEVGVLLKQGYYNYQFLQLDDEGRGHVERTMGSFYETENEYVILVYHRPQGARYDALVGYQRVICKVES